MTMTLMMSAFSWILLAMGRVTMCAGDASKTQANHSVQILSLDSDKLPATTFRVNRKHVAPNLMLIDGAAKSEGTVLVNVKGRWGTVCDDNWTLKEANVVCRMLGFPHALQATTRDYFFSNDNYMMDDVVCEGTETDLNQCSFWLEHDCQRREEAGVICLNPEPIQWSYNVRRPGLKGVSSDQAQSMRHVSSVHGVVTQDQQPFTIQMQDIDPQTPSLIRAQLLLDVEVNGAVCVDQFFGAEANVVCRAAGRGFGQSYHQEFLFIFRITRSHSGRLARVVGMSIEHAANGVEIVHIPVSFPSSLTVPFEMRTGPSDIFLKI